MKVYTSTGLVFGNCQGGGYAAYRARPLRANTKEELLAQATKGIEDGSLDSGMGYESLMGAVLNVVETETIVKDGKEYKHEEDEIEFVGLLNEEEQRVLTQALFDCQGLILSFRDGGQK